MEHFSNKPLQLPIPIALVNGLLRPGITKDFVDNVFKITNRL